MNDTDRDDHDRTCAEAEATETVPQPQALTPADSKPRKSLSMHEGIAVWCDCCTCEAEPYWVEIAEEMGVDLGSDYENTDKWEGRRP